MEHTVDVLVQVMAPKDSGSYDWTTINVIRNPASLDVDYLKGEVKKLPRKSDYVPPFDILRLVVRKDEKAEMKIMIDGFFGQTRE